MALIDLNTLGKWLAGIQLGFGLVCVVAALRTRNRVGELVAPLGAMFVVQGVSYFLRGTAPEEILMPLQVLVFLAALVWFVRGYRASRARTRALLEPQGRS